MGFEKKPLGVEKKTYVINHLGMKLFQSLLRRVLKTEVKLCVLLCV